MRPLVGAVAVLVAVPAVVLTGARVAGGAHQRLVILQAFAPWAVPLYLLVLVLAGGLLLRRATRWPGRRPVAVAAVPVAALLVLHLGWAAPAVVGSRPADARADGPVVMTSNLRFGQGDPQEVVDAAVEHDVDVLVLEEVTPAALAALEDAGLADRFPYRAGRARPGALGTIALSRTQITDPVRVGTEMGSWAFTTAGLRVMAVHPAYPLDVDWGSELGLLRDAVTELRPDVVAGDFNASRDHAPMRAILATGLADAADLANAGWQPTWPTGGYDGLPLPATVAIDHVLVGRALTATSTTTVAIDGSDHRALVAHLARVAANAGAVG